MNYKIKSSFFQITHCHPIIYAKKKLSFLSTIMFVFTFMGVGAVPMMDNSLNASFSKASEWVEITSVEELWQNHPDRLRVMFSALDLSHPGLEKVQHHLQSNDTVRAAEALLGYYRQSDVADWLLEQSAENDTEQMYVAARQLLNDTVTFHGVTARVPHDTDGGWQWDFQGPGQDAEFGYSMNGHKYMVSLLHAWQTSENEDFVKKFDQLIRDWIIHNPLPPESDSIYLVLSSPLDWRDIGEVIWRDLEAGQRMGVTWPLAFYGFQQSDAFTPAARLLMLSSIAEQAEYLKKYHKKGHNWTTMEMNGLALAGLTFPEFAHAADWTTYAMNVMEKEINRQVYPDGVQTEISSKTQWVALWRFESIANNFRDAGRSVKPEYLQRIEEMYNFLAYAMRPDAHQPLNNDSDREDLRPRVLNAAQTYNRPDWEGIATNGKSGALPEGLPSVVFPWAGIHVMRSGWGNEAHWAFFDAGPFGTGHQHADMLHLSVAAFGKDLLVDGGRYTHKNYFSFDPTVWRGYFRSSFSHNVILIDGKGQNGGPLTVDKPQKDGVDYMNTADFDFARGTFTSGFNEVAGKANHTRAVLYVRDKFWIVVDQIDTDRPRKLEALWHYAPSCEAVIEDESVVSVNAGEGNLRIVPVGGIDWDVEMVKGQETPNKQGWNSAEYGIKVPNTTAVFNQQIESSATFAWVLLPAKGKVPNVKADLIAQDDDKMQIEVVIENDKPITVTVPFKAGEPEVSYQ